MTDVEGVMDVIDRMAHDGLPRNTHICHQISGPIWQRTKGRLRLLFFCDGEMHRLILTHGFVKKTRKTPSSEVEHALAFYRAYEKAKSDNTLVFGGINEQ